MLGREVSSVGAATRCGQAACVQLDRLRDRCRVCVAVCVVHHSLATSRRPGLGALPSWWPGSSSSCWAGREPCWHHASVHQGRHTIRSRYYLVISIKYTAGQQIKPLNTLHRTPVWSGWSFPSCWAVRWAAELDALPCMLPLFTHCPSHSEQCGHDDVLYFAVLGNTCAP